ncbi:hypothetical protein DRJ22_02555 [Candidatus Woesearchaeota archaeon]|nr:MAG: hypothetical protein DRJ22_02555 [Candidatus Woesearchaeota archaeon]
MKKGIILFLISALIILTGCSQINYDPNYELKPDYVLKAAGFNKTKYIEGLKKEIKGDEWGKGDTYLILARLENSTEYYKKSCEKFLKYKPKNNEEKAILYETIASLNCKNKREKYLKKAIKEWEKTRAKWRVKLLKDILEDKNTTNLKFDTTEIEPKLNLSKYNKIIIGKTKITIDKKDRLVLQVDRVLRDWLGEQMNQNPFDGKLLAVFSERLFYNKTWLKENIGWHEGGRARDIKKATGIKPQTATGTIIAKHKGKWYAPDEKGIFRFEIPLDKASYPTTRFLTKNIGMIVDTHGINMLVEQAIRKNATIVMGCCDHPAKIKAAKYLSDKGKKILCFTDLYLYKALGHNAKIVGSPVFTTKNKTIIFGNSPIELRKNQKIIVSKAKIGKTYAIWYYNAPYFYFKEINKTFPLKIIPMSMDDFNQTKKLYDRARKENIDIIATRIYEKDDYEQAKKWLKENKNHKIILFHSTSYPNGVLLMQEFENQVSFDDPNIEGVISEAPSQ